MTDAGGKNWRLWRAHDIPARLASEENPDLIDEVLDALAAVEANPVNPEGVAVHELRGRAIRPGGPRRVAELPHGWRLSYDLLEAVPPLMLNMIRVHAFVKDHGARSGSLG